MKKLYNIVFPIWFILIMPPIVLLVIPSNFIIDSIVLILGFKLLKLNNWFEKYKNIILKVWIIGFIVDILGSFLLLITQFIPNNDFLYNNLIYPLAWNPFNKPLAFIYVFLILLICGFLIYFINYKISFKKVELEEKSKKTISLLLSILTVPYLFLLPTSYFYKEDKTLEKYQDSYIGDNSAVGYIIDKISSGEYLNNFILHTKKEPYGITINYKESSYGDIYKNIEQDSLILFKLIKNVSYVEFKINNKTYTFDTKYINNIYNDIKKIDLNDIYERYNNEYFQKFTYLGHIDDYDLFDTSSTCGTNENELYSDDNYNYFIECSNIDTLYLVNDKIKIKLQTALNKKQINIDDLFKINLKISKKNKEEKK